MKTKSPFKKSPLAKLDATRKFVWFTVVLLAADRSVKLLANPTGMTVGAGSATIQQIGQQLNITTSQ